MWTPDTRADHDRDELRYPSDLTDAEWQILAPLLPPPAETGRHRCWPMREMMNAIFFVLRGGCPWRMLPAHFPPHQTDGRGLKLQVHPASVQDRDGAIPLLRASRALYPFIERAFADSAYAAERVANATRVIVEIVANRPARSALPCIHAAGWSSVSSPGSGASAVSPRTSRLQSPPQQRSSMPL